MALFLSPRVTQDVSTVWSGTRKESKYEIRHLQVLEKDVERLGGGGFSFFFVDLRTRVDPKEELGPLISAILLFSAVSLSFIHQQQHKVK